MKHPQIGDYVSIIRGVYTGVQGEIINEIDPLDCGPVLFELEDGTQIRADWCQRIRKPGQ